MECTYVAPLAHKHTGARTYTKLIRSLQKESIYVTSIVDIRRLTDRNPTHTAARVSGPICLSDREHTQQFSQSENVSRLCSGAHGKATTKHAVHLRSHSAARQWYCQLSALACAYVCCWWLLCYSTRDIERKRSRKSARGLRVRVCIVSGQDTALRLSIDINDYMNDLTHNHKHVVCHASPCRTSTELCWLCFPMLVFVPFTL